MACILERKSDLVAADILVLDNKETQCKALKREMDSEQYWKSDGIKLQSSHIKEAVHNTLTSSWDGRQILTVYLLWWCAEINYLADFTLLVV